MNVYLMAGGSGIVSLLNGVERVDRSKEALRVIYKRRTGEDVIEYPPDTKAVCCVTWEEFAGGKE